MSTQITNIADFRSNIAQFIDLVAQSGNPVILVRHGDPVAALISNSDLKAFQEWKEQNWLYTGIDDKEQLAKFKALSQEIEKEWGDSNSNYTVTQEEIDALNY